MKKVFKCSAFPFMTVQVGYVTASFVGGLLETEDDSIIAECENSPFITPFTPGPEPVPEVEAPKEESAKDEEPLQYYNLPKRTTKHDAIRYAMDRGLNVDIELTLEEFLAAVNEAQKDKL